LSLDYDVIPEEKDALNDECPNCGESIEDCDCEEED